MTSSQRFNSIAKTVHASFQRGCVDPTESAFLAVAATKPTRA